MTIKVGDSLPDVTTKTWSDGPADLSVSELVAGKTVAIFGVPGAFTPTCHMKHLPGFVEHAAALKEKGVDLVAVHSVNDPFVMNMWVKDQQASDILTIADWDASMAKAMGVDADMSAVGLGTRTQRYGMVLKDGVVTYFAIGDLDVSGAEAILAAL